MVSVLRVLTLTSTTHSRWYDAWVKDLHDLADEALLYKFVNRERLESFVGNCGPALRRLTGHCHRCQALGKVWRRECVCSGNLNRPSPFRRCLSTCGFTPLARKCIARFFSFGLFFRRSASWTSDAWWPASSSSRV